MRAADRTSTRASADMTFQTGPKPGLSPALLQDRLGLVHADLAGRKVLYHLVGIAYRKVQAQPGQQVVEPLTGSWVRDPKMRLDIPKISSAAQKHLEQGLILASELTVAAMGEGA